MRDTVLLFVFAVCLLGTLQTLSEPPEREPMCKHFAADKTWQPCRVMP